jgi:hypothetical protein
MKNQNDEFVKYVGTIKSRAKYFAKCYQLEYEDVLSQGYVIYQITLQRYIENQAAFNTFLYKSLSIYLRDYCMKAKRLRDREICVDDEKLLFLIDSNPDASSFSKRAYSLTIEGIKQYAKDLLTPDAYDLFTWALQCKYENNKSFISDAKLFYCGVYKWDLNRFYIAWNEIKYFWCNKLIVHGELI